MRSARAISSITRPAVTPPSRSRPCSSGWRRRGLPPRPTVAATSPGSIRCIGRALCGRARPRKHCAKRERPIGWSSPTPKPLMPSARRRPAIVLLATFCGAVIVPLAGWSWRRAGCWGGPVLTSPGCAKNRPSPESLLEGRRSAAASGAPSPRHGLGSPASRVTRRLSVSPGAVCSAANCKRCRERQIFRCCSCLSARSVSRENHRHGLVDDEGRPVRGYRQPPREARYWVSPPHLRFPFGDGMV